MPSSRVAEALGQLAIYATDDFSVEDMLHRLGDVAAQLLRVDGAGVMGVQPGHVERTTRFVHASGLWLEPLESLQEVSQAGPCKDAALSMAPIVCFTFEEMTRRWPTFADAAYTAGVRAVAAAPLVSRGRVWGVLDLYWFQEVELDAADIADIALLAKVVASYLVIADDRREAAITRQQLAARLLHDPLTGLANRELIHELIFHALANSHRRRRPVALLFLDLDGFKTVNDTRGHRAGDIVLRTVGQRMRSVVRSSDTVSRLGGDEFLVLCEDLSAEAARDGLADLAERMLDEIGKPITVDAFPPVRIGACIGIAVAEDRRSVSNFIHDADQAMYRAKRQPGSSVAVHHPTAGAGRAQEHEIFGALERGELQVYYQPIVAPNGQSLAAEALLRWNHPAMGLLEASVFINLAISTGAIIEIGHWLIGQVLAQSRAWRNTMGVAAPAAVFVNLTPLELIDPHLPAIIDTHLTEQDLLPTALCIEITEQALGDARAQPSAAYYQGKGHPLALDDFGTGYSSLGRLIDLPVTYLKLDRLLVARLPEGDRARAMLEAILVIAGKLKLQVIAEGVENAQQATYLSEAGCHLQQGFYHGRPQPASRFGTPDKTVMSGR